MLNQKQNNLLTLAVNKGVEILNIADYQNKNSILTCRCVKGQHEFHNTVEMLLNTDFECIQCLQEEVRNVKDLTPFFLALDAASYVTGASIFNKEGQLLGHKTISLSKKELFFNRVHALKQEIDKIIQEQNIQCVILEDIQYQQNPILFKKLAMLQGVLRYTVIQEHGLPLITALADEWRSYNHIWGLKRQDQKKAAIERAHTIFQTDIPEDESESIFLGYYGIHLFNTNAQEEE